MDKDKLEDMSLDKMDKTPSLSCPPSKINYTF
nr:MAG TPA: CtsR-like protein [Caudoviricetes sp.]